VKRVLGYLGLSTNRLIRVSYGPFQLGDLAEGEVREIRGKVLRDQLGAKLAQAAGADFEAPIRPVLPPAAAVAKRPRPVPRPKAGKRDIGRQRHADRRR
jgi:23S rRNA pseudouridine2605 synthase